MLSGARDYYIHCALGSMNFVAGLAPRALQWVGSLSFIFWVLLFADKPILCISKFNILKIVKPLTLLSARESSVL